MSGNNINGNFLFIPAILLVVFLFFSQNIPLFVLLLIAIILIALFKFNFKVDLNNKLGFSTSSEKNENEKLILWMGFIILSFVVILLIKMQLTSSTVTSTVISKVAPTVDTTSSLNQTPTLTALQSVKLIEDYLETKNNILGREYSKADARKFTTGKIYNELVADEYQKGSIDWLKKNNAYFKFINNKVTGYKDFVLSKENTSINVRVIGRSSYFVNNKEANNKGNNNGKPFNCEYTYNFQLHEGVWKISDRPSKFVLCNPE